MSNEQLPTQNTLVPTDNRGLAAPARGLVRRGLHMLLTEQVQRDTLWEKYNNAGIEAFEQDHYAEAEASFLAALRKAERFGSQDLRLAKSLHNLANAYYKQGNCAEAEPLYERALAIAEQTIGIEHPDIAGRYYKGVLWSPRYFAASCGGAPLSIIRQYIEEQRQNL
jgi:tetratricopeptide (TPR) repeat protein